jgi:hypothetical protein
MAELKANNQKPNFDNNPKLIEAIAEMRKNFCAETQNKVINTALACTFLVPAMVEKTTELVLSFGTEILSHFCDSFYKLRVVVEIWFLIVSLEFCHF